jgi:hypothetical protein
VIIYKITYYSGSPVSPDTPREYVNCCAICKYVLVPDENEYRLCCTLSHDNCLSVDGCSICYKFEISPYAETCFQIRINMYNKLARLHLQAVICER